MATRVQPHTDRRAFFVALAGIAALSLAATVRYLWPLPDSAPSPLVSAGRVDRLIADDPVAFLQGRFWLVKRENGEVLALSMKDPHLGCSVVWRPDFQFQERQGWFRNPCHGQTYDLEGYCHYGPCVRGLDRYPVTVQSGQVIVDTRRLDPGPSLRPEDCLTSYGGGCVLVGERLTCPGLAWVTVRDTDPLGLDPDHDGVACN
jgi:nitrite reductase/ring-hydroxylating ferredoxin subunit